MPHASMVRHAVAAFATAALVLAAGHANAQTYPAANKITLIVAFAPGGIADTLARLIAEGLSERLHQTVVVENRGGAGGNIAAAFVARAAPDGYTLLATTTALAINETLFANKEFAAIDFKTVAIAAISPEALVTAADNPASNLVEFLKNMNGKTINFAVPGVGTGSDIEAEYFFKFLAKAPAQMIPFQGGAPAINATIGNQVDLMATTLGGGAAAQIAGGKLKGLGIAADKRAAVTPNVPTYAEQGFTGFTAASWVGFFAPAKTDPQIVATLNGAIDDIVKTPEVQKKLTDMGFDPITGAPAQADAMFGAEVTKWGDMVKALGLSIK
ncbi:MAG TPA: tripartite tricarboxylate transporter substrate-binding protein [Xanthobacteraceae bacterium]|jgi:tripartite-type tricarboxylate transporter receptor subunit TctC|nr:tripartite tricarboxylate transporter substrate-binding protein [Xanthobacteraceae bacterium]